MALEKALLHAALEKALRDAMPGWFGGWSDEKTATLQTAIAQAAAAEPPLGSSLHSTLLEAREVLRRKLEEKAREEEEEKARREAEKRARSRWAQLRLPSASLEAELRVPVLIGAAVGSEALRALELSEKQAKDKQAIKKHWKGLQQLMGPDGTLYIWPTFHALAPPGTWRDSCPSLQARPLGDRSAPHPQS